MRWRIIAALVLLPLAVWSGLVLTYTGALGGGVVAWRAVCGALVGLGMVAAPLALRGWRGVAVSGALAAGAAAFWGLHAPSNERAWSPAASRTAWAEIEGTQVHFHDVRDFRHEAGGAGTPGWYDARYDAAEIEGAELLMTTFGGVEGLAHVMVSFGFKDGRRLVISAEIRREVGEEYHPVGGAFRQFELFYVVADERDALALRTHVHQDPTWAFPVNASPEKISAFFLDMVRRVNSLHARPEWYNSVTSSCASNLADHYGVIRGVALPPDYRVLLPGFAGEVLEEEGLLPEGMRAEEALATFRIDERARALPLDEGFSRALRAP